MDKETLSNYGWIVICVLVLAVMIALATPFGQFISDAVWNTANGLFDTNNSALDTALGSVGVDTRIEDLEKKYEFEYFGSMADAVSGTNGNADKAGAVVGAYTDENGVKNVILYDNVNLTSKVTTSGNINIDLSGKKITCTDSVAFDFTGGTAVIDATKSGSAIESSGRIANVSGGNVTFNGGTYTSTTNGGGTKTNHSRAFHIASGATLTVNDAKITSNDTNKGTVAGVYGAANSNFIASGCTIEGVSKGSLETAGVYSLGNVKLTNCSSVAKSDYTANAAGNNYATNSRGVYCEGKLELYNCYVWGAHAGVTTKGDLIVDGGTYEGYGHGGIYCANAGKTLYIKNATIQYADMLDGYVADAVAGTNGAGMYIGGASNITIYMDNCDAYGTLYGIVLRHSSGEKNNSLYLSNSNITGSKYAFRLKTSGQNLMVYNGVGNTLSSPTIDISSGLVKTEDSYAH